ncbi:hypothetical protein [uncultured Amnibacterium sp.]|uniref:arsenate reductase/protein-tyrosine-phosphatase family protein n=1 Tax=uncultured Amnibacterium sp. TaxID=1631851 RepID=UPI0035CB42C4
MTDERDQVRVLVVCTANICRSPLAERTLQRAFAGSPALAHLTVRSAGTFAEQDAAMCALSATLLDRDDDGDWVQAHRSRRLTAELVAASDLVLTMEREQRSIAARLAPGSQAKIFTITEAAQLAELLADDRATSGDRSIVSLAQGLHGKRGYAPQPPAPPRRWGRRRVEPVDHLTVPDGHGQSERVHRQAVEATRAAATRLAAALERAIGADGA